MVKFKIGLCYVDNQGMNNIVILNALNLSEYAYKELYSGSSSVDFAIEAASKMPEAPSKAVILAEGASSAAFSGFTICESGLLTPSGLIEVLSEISDGFDNIFYYNADCPLVDIELTQKMYGNHEKYFCEYTFADGYPLGMSVEIIKTAILPMLSKLAESSDGGIERNTVFSLIEKDINAFEIETEISPDDQRLLRVALYPDTKRNFNQLKLLTEAVKDTDLQAEKTTAGIILDTVRSQGEALRSLPVFFEFETTSMHPQLISYMPPGGGISNTGGDEMDVESFKSALQKISAFSDDAVISLSIRNEPSIHSEVSLLVDAVLEYKNFSILIETSGLGWNEEQLTKILAQDEKRISWIIDLDALDPELYKYLRGDGYNEAYSFAGRLIELNKENVWVQIIRMKENEEDNELFYKYWKERTNNVIIQKYDWCCGRLEQKKVTDLSPVKRLPCWHLKREMAILADGRVPLCRDDLDCELLCGNLFTDDIESVWKAAEDVYRQHLNEEYPGICRNCDEYYTYNY